MPRPQRARVCCEQTPTPARAPAIAAYSPATCSEGGKALEPCAGQGWAEGSGQRERWEGDLHGSSYLSTAGCRGDAVANAHSDLERKPTNAGPGSTSNFSLIHNILNWGHPVQVCRLRASVGASFPLRQDGLNPQAPHYTAAKNPAFRVTSPGYAQP